VLSPGRSKAVGIEMKSGRPQLRVTGSTMRPPLKMR